MATRFGQQWPPPTTPPPQQGPAPMTGGGYMGRPPAAPPPAAPPNPAATALLDGQQKYWPAGGGGAYTSPTRSTGVPNARAFNARYDPNQWFYQQQAPEQQGHAWLSDVLSDPYNVPDAALRNSLQGANRAYDVARQRATHDTLGSGAAQGGVARGVRANVETSRAGGISDALRQWEQYKLGLGDERLRSLYIPYLQTAQNARSGVANRVVQQQGQQQQSGGGSIWGDVLGVAGGALGAYYGGPAGYQAGSQLGSSVGNSF